MIQKITQNNGNFWTVNLIMRAKIVNQSSDFPVRRTGSYRRKKALLFYHYSATSVLGEPNKKENTKIHGEAVFHLFARNSPLNQI